jgi:hypothetical protein
MAALDFPASPTVGLVATLTNGFSYQWDGAVWTLTPASPGQVAGGDLTGTYPAPTLLTVGAEVTINGTLPSVPANTNTTLSWDAAIYNRSAAWSAGNPTQLLLPVPGVYLVVGHLQWGVSAVGGRVLYIANKAGTQLAQTAHQAPATANVVNQTVQFLYVTSDPTDYVYQYVWQNSGGPLGLDSGSRPRLAVWRLAT